jgi:RNA polymerase sigma factor (sigma-70 family)
VSLLDDMGLSSEAEILRRVRDGDVATFGVLYERHLGAARRLARSLLADPSDADDVVAEVFAATFAAMRKGRGPADDFRSYVLTSVRRECQRTWRRGGRQRPGGEHVVDIASARAGDCDEIERRTEDDVVLRVFASLPDHMREALWASEVEGLSHATIAARTGATSAAVAQLIVRARRLLGERYLDAHLPGAGAEVPATCVATRRVLAEVVRGTASATQRHLADDHLASCSTCVSASDHLRVVNHRLRAGHVLALAPAITASKPVRVGVLARFFGWLFGSTPVITASAALVLVAAVAPEAPRRADASSVAPASAVVPDETGGAPATPDLDDPEAPRTRPPTASTARSTPTAGAVADPEVVPGPGTAPALPPPTDAAGITLGGLPTGPASVGVDNTLGGLIDTVGTVGDGIIGGGLESVLDATSGGVAQTINDMGVDDDIVAAVQPTLDALAPIHAGAQVAPTSAGSLDLTPPIFVEADAGGGSVGVSAGAGSAHVSVGVGGPDGVQVDLPGAGDLLSDG